MFLNANQDMMKMSVHELCERIKEHALHQQWHEAMRLYEHVICARCGELSEEERDNLRLVIRPALETKQPQECVSDKPIKVITPPTSTPEIKKEKKNTHPVRVKESTETDDIPSFPSDLWREFLRVSRCLIPAFRQEIRRNTWIRGQLQLLQKTPVEQRTSVVTAFFEACNEALFTETLSREVVSTLLSVFYVHDIITCEECKHYTAHMGMYAEASFTLEEDD